MPQRIIILICLLLATVACGTQKESDKKENVLMEQFGTMDKARAVEGSLQDAQDKRRADEEAQSGE